MISVVTLTHNRLAVLPECIEAILNNTESQFELIVVDNGSTDGTVDFLLTLLNAQKLRPVFLDANYGVTARNHGFKLARGEIIAQVDDDVVVHPGWDKKVLEAFNDPEVGMVGQQGGIISHWLSLSTHRYINGYADELTGFILCFRNIGLFYDENIDMHWFEDLELSMQFKHAGYRLKKLDALCHHNCQKRSVDWSLHDKNFDYVFRKWKDKVHELNLEGMKH